MNDSLPKTSARAVAVCTLLGTVGFALAQPSSLAGAVAGALFGLGLTGFAGSLRRRTLSAALLPLGVVGTVGGVSIAADGALSSSVAGAGLGVLSVFLGVGFVSLQTERLSATTFDRAARSAFVASLVGSLLALLALRISTLGGLAEAFRLLVGLTGSGPSGLALWLVATTVMAIVAVLAIPVPPLDSTATRPSSYQHRRRLLATVAIAGVATVVGTVVLAVTTLQSIAPVVAGLTILQSGVTVLFVLCLALAVGGLVVRVAWVQTATTRTDVVATLVGSTAGIVTVLGGLGVLGVDPGMFLALPVALGITGGGLFLGPSVLGGFDQQTGGVRLTTAVAISLVAGAVLIGAVSGRTTAVGRPEIGALLALGAGLFAFELGSYGHQLTDEVGLSGASRLPQIARIGWAGGLVVFGIAVAVVGLQVTTLVTLTLPVPATLGIVGALLGILGVGWLLLRSNTSV